MKVPIELLNAPPNYEVRLEGAPRARVIVRGVREVVEQTRAEQIRASVDLSRAKLARTASPSNWTTPPNGASRSR